MKLGDMNTRFIKDLPQGHILWRCINAAGVRYSYITDRDGFEIMSSETDREKEMMQTFYKYTLKDRYKP